MSMASDLLSNHIKKDNHGEGEQDQQSAHSGRALLLAVRARRVRADILLRSDLPQPRDQRFAGQGSQQKGRDERKDQANHGRPLSIRPPAPPRSFPSSSPASL